MRKIFLLSLLISSLTLSQNFFKQDSDDEEKNIFQIEENIDEEEESIQFFDGNSFKLGEFFADQNHVIEEDLLEQIIAARDPNNDDDFPTGPGTFTPIDDGLFLLSIFGIGIGYYYLRRFSIKCKV